MNKNTFTKTEFEDILNNTPKELIKKDINIFKDNQITKIGYYKKPLCNWKYTMYTIIYNNSIIKVATSLGKIKGRKI